MQCIIIATILLSIIHYTEQLQISATIQASNYTINKETSYTIQIIRYLDPLTGNFISPVEPATIGSYVQIIFPNDYQTLSSVTNPSCVNSATGATLICTVTEANKTITIYNYYATATTTSDSQLSIQIANLKNPRRATQTSNFQYVIKRPNNQILDSSPSATNPVYNLKLTFQPGLFTACVISANNNYVSTRSRLTFTITPNNPIPSGGKILIDIPLKWSGDIQNLNTIQSSPTCVGINGVSGSLSCTSNIFPSPVSIARITISSINTSQIVGQFIIDISLILTPPFINSPQLVSISSQWSDDIKIDTCSSVIGQTQAIPFAGITFTSLDNTIVQSTFNSRLQLILKKPFYYQDEINLQVPQIFIKNGQITVTSSNFAIFTTSVSGKIVTLTNFPSTPSTIATNTIINLFFTSITNPESLQPITIIADFRRQNQIYQKSSITYTAVVGTNLQIQIQSDNQAVNAVNNTIFRISSPTLYVPQNSIFQMEYHSSIPVANIGETPVVRASLGGTVATGVTYQVQSNVLSISNLFTSNVTANKLIQIEIGQFHNPPTIKPTLYNIKIRSSNTYLIIQNSYSYVASLQTLKYNSISASSLKVMDSSVTYTVSFESNYGFKAVSIIIPSQIYIVPGYETTCSPNSYTSCSLNENNLTFIGTMSAGTHSIQWGNNANPNSFKPTSTFSIYTYSSGWGVEKSSGYITLTMNSQASLISKQVKTSSIKNNAPTNIEIDFSVPSNSPSGVFSIAIPTVIDIFSATCTVSSGQTCNIIPPIVSIEFSNPSPIFGGSSKRLITTLQNAVNAFSYQAVPQFTLALVTVDSYASVSSTISAWTNTLPSTFSTTVTSNDAYKLQSALFTFGLTGLTAKQTYINIKINQLFGELTVAPTNATLVSTHEVRYNISAESSTSIAFILKTPQYSGDYTFTLKTYTTDGYIIGESTSNVWRHNCFGTQCRACYANNSCINCYNSTISQYYIYSTDSKECARQCNQGYHLSATNCIPCNANCKQCTTSATNCTACQQTKFLDNIYDICVTDCQPQYYKNNLNKECTPCISPCLQCSTVDNCITCQLGFYLLGTQCLAECPNGIMVKYEVNRTCRSCVSTCRTCQTYDYFCISCDTGKGLHLDNNQCVQQCSSNKFPENGVCTACKLPCKICHNSTTTCSTCYADQALSLWFNFKCISPSQCAVGHYVNSVNLSCDACPTQCEQCLSLTNCTACAENFYLYSFQCIGTCPNVTFVNIPSRTCDTCTECTTCTLSNECTTCKLTQYLYDGSCFTLCPSSTFPTIDANIAANQKQICVTCQIQCPTCVNSTFCTSCVSGQYLYKGVCYGTCPTDSYQASSTNCQTCPVTCATCTSLTNCLTCKATYSLQHSLCVLKCAAGYSDQQICYPCGLHCQDCQVTTCQRCQPPYYLLKGACIDNCSLSTLTLDGLNCVPCTQKFSNCTTCNEDQCLSCSDGQLLNKQCFPCSEGFYSRNSHCTRCPSACAICQNVTFCTQCTTGFYSEADYCVNTCPDNKVPNGTKCDFCVQNCAICDIQTSLCSICNAGIYRYEGLCVNACPDSLVVNLNATLCVTQQEFAEQYSKESRTIYFPFTISTVIIIIIGIILKCYTKIMHLATFLVSIIAWLQLGSWILFVIIQYLFYTNLQTQSLIGLICAGVGIVFLIITNLIFLRFFYKYFSDDMDYIKWEKNHRCVSKVFVVLSTIFSFKIHRILYCKLLQRQQFSMVLSSVKKLIPISILSIVSIFVSSAPVGVGASLALYFSLNVDQEFFSALDTLTVTGIMLVLLILDIRHPPNYLIDELETQNIKNKIYQEDDQKFEHEHQNGDFFGKNDGNMSKQNLMVGDRQDSGDQNFQFQKTAKRFRNNYTGDNKGGKTLRDGQTLLGNKNNDIQDSIQIEENEESKQKLSIDNSQQQVAQKGQKWLPKQFDNHGYLLKYDQNQNPVKYDNQGHRVEIDEEGNHHKYDENGLEAIQDENGNFAYYNKDGYRVDKKTNKLFDSRGYEVKNNPETNTAQFYDEHGYKVIEDSQTGNQIKIDQNGYLIKIDQETKQHKQYDRDTGYRVGEYNGKTSLVNEDGEHMRQKANGEWQSYDPEDGFILKKNPQSGKYEKFDENGFIVDKDQYGNVYRYQPETGYRIIIDQNGNIKRYDDEGYLVKKDIYGKQHRYDEDGYQVVKNQQGQKIFYDDNGYRVERDFYGNLTLYDKDDNLVIIDKDGKHHKYNKEGLQIIADENGNTYLRDKRGRKVVELEDGYYQKYDEADNKIWLDEDGYELQTDENGNMLKYDKVGDLVEDEDEDEEQGDNQIILEEDQGLQGVTSKGKRKDRKKFKVAKEYDFEQEYQKMLHQNNPQLLFDDDESIEEEHLKEFHDFEPPQQRQLEDEYNNLYGKEMDEDLQRSYSMNSILLQNLADIQHTPWINLKEKKNNEDKKIKEDRQIDKNKMTIDPEGNLQKFEAKSVADVSISQRSFENEGVNPISNRNSRDNDQLNSVEEIDALEENRKMKKLVNKRSHASFVDQDKAETRSQNNFMKGDNIPVTIKKSKNNLYDSDEEIESLQEQQWQNQQNPNIFYKDKPQFSNANTNDKILDDQEDILSDYVPHQSIDQQSRYHKRSQQNLGHMGRNMQSIEEVEDQLFQRLKKEEQKVKRTEFRLSGAPNPLLQYAKTIEQQKLTEKDKDGGQRNKKKQSNKRHYPL